MFCLCLEPSDHKLAHRFSGEWSETFSSSADASAPLESLAQYVLSSGVSGALARTLVAPVERNRLLMQAQKLFPKAAMNVKTVASTVSTTAAVPSQSVAQQQQPTTRPAVRGLFQGLRTMFLNDGLLTD